MRNKAVVSFVLVLLFFVSVFPLSSLSGAADSHGSPRLLGSQSTVDPTDWWTMFHHDLTHTGYSTSTAPNTNQTLWIYTTVSTVSSSPAVAGGVLYIGSNRDDDKVYALNATTGLLIWSYTTGGSVESSPAVADGVVYVGSTFNESGQVDGNVYALNATTGELIWNYTTGSSGVYSSPAVTGGVVYVGSFYPNGGTVYALNATTGLLIWSYTTDGGVWSSPAVTGGVVYVGSYDDNVYALNATTGELIWNYTTGDFVVSSPAVVDGVVYVGSEDNKVYALNATTGELIWSYTAGDDVMSSPAVADGVVYIGLTLDHGKFVALNATTGELIWSYATEGGVGGPYSSPAVVGGVVYEGSSQHVYAFGASAPGGDDVAVTNVASSKTVVAQGFSASINVTVADQGSYQETFNVTVYVNGTSIGKQEVTALPSGNSAQLVFTWNTTGFAHGNYTLSAYAWPVPGETDTANNNFTCSVPVHVGVPGDVSSTTPGVYDGITNMKDIAYLVSLFQTKPNKSNWDPNADVNNDGVVDMKDIAIAVYYFNQHE